jgi:hypothetical protein
MLFNRKVENLIAELRSLPSNKSVSKLRGTLGIGEALDSVLDRYRINKPRLEELIMKHWDYIVGENRSHRSAPQRIVRGTELIVMVGNMTLRQELEFEKRQILSRLRQIPECSSINSVRFVSGN